MPRSSSTRELRALALGGLLAASGLWTGCKSDPAEKSATPAQRTEPATPDPVGGAVPSGTATPLDRSYVPIEALEQLEGLRLESVPPCSDTIATLKPALDSIASHRKKLTEANTEAAVAQLLTALSAELSAQRPAIATRTETEELQRISDELAASIGDLAESLKLASDALTAQDRQASATVLRRIQNGVTNTRSSIERLINQCAS